MEGDADRAAEVLERILVDPAFRARFREDPTATCREAGLDHLAAEIEDASLSGKAMHTLADRESRSSLAGVMMAAAVEGIGVAEFAHHVVPLLERAPRAVRDVVARMRLPTIRGALAATPSAPPVAPTGGAGADHAAAAAAMPEPAARAEAAPSTAGAQMPAPAHAPTSPVADAAAQDAATAEPAKALLHDPQVALDAAATAAVRRGDLDPRLVDLLHALGERHALTVHLAAGDAPGIDITNVDGEPVSDTNVAAHELAIHLASMDGRLRPDRLGSPWAIRSAGAFHDTDHQDRLHLAFTDPGQAPAAAPAAAAAVAPPSSSPDAVEPRSAPAVAAAKDAPAVGVPAVAPAAGAASAPADTLGLPAHGEARAAGSGGPPPTPRHDTLGLGVPAAGGRPRSGSAVADAAAGTPAPGGGAYPGENASKAQLAAWMAGEAERRGLPGELPVMASLVESGIVNNPGGDADSAGFFQMRVSVWDRGPYAGYRQHPELQLKWFLDTAERVRADRVARGLAVDDPRHYGEWIADVERPLAQYRGRYQLRLADAQELVRQRSAPAGHADAGQPAGAPALAPQAPIDPGQYGVAGSGGHPDAQAEALLHNKNVVLDASGIADVRAGRIDPRVVSVLETLSHKHRITVSCTASDHPELTSTGSVSNHHFGRAVDIAAIDGQPVGPGNEVARQVAQHLGDLPADIRPDEVGGPWLVDVPGSFTNAEHQDHLHVGFRELIASDWRPPGPTAGAARAAGAVGSVLGVADPAVAPAPAPVEEAHTLGLPLAARAAVVQGSRHTLGLPAAAAPLPAAPAPQAVPAVDAAAPAPAPGGAGLTPGARALGAVAIAKAQLGVPYHWGGSSPATGFDCSGLVQWAYAHEGIQIPRTSEEQILAPHGTPVDRHHLLPGDLVFFRNPSGDVHHVGISLGGDRFLEAPHTGANVRENSLDDPYYAQQFAGGRRFAHAADVGAAADPVTPTAPVAPADPSAVEAAQAAVQRDAAAAHNPDTLTFRKLTAQEASHHNATVHFLRAIRPEEAHAVARAANDAAVTTPLAPSTPEIIGPTIPYPGDHAPRAEVARWLGRVAQRHGLPAELPVMAALVESDLRNVQGGDADSLGLFQMRVSVWDRQYPGYANQPALQARWFVDQALAVKRARLAAGDATFGRDPAGWGEWVADIERPEARLRGRYAERLDEARRLLRGAGGR